MSEHNEEAANELCRMFFRKRASLFVGKEDWRNEARPFWCDGQRYFLGRHYFWVKDGDRSTTLRPNKYMLETLREVIRQRSNEQDAQHDQRVTMQLLRAAQP